MVLTVLLFVAFDAQDLLFYINHKFFSGRTTSHSLTISKRTCKLIIGFQWSLLMTLRNIFKFKLA